MRFQYRKRATRRFRRRRRRRLSRPFSGASSHSDSRCPRWRVGSASSIKLPSSLRCSSLSFCITIIFSRLRISSGCRRRLRLRNALSSVTMCANSIGGIIGSTCTFRRCASGAILSSKDALRRRRRGVLCLSRPMAAARMRRNRTGMPRDGPHRPRLEHPTTVAIFLTGSTGYIGAHVLANLLERSGEKFNLLVRARDDDEARQRLWRAVQIHLDFPRFRELLDSRVTFYRGDLTGSRFGLDDAQYRELIRTTDSVIHCAASLNRKSEKACLNVNLRGTLQVIQVASRADADHGFRRVSHVSTGAGSGMRSNEVVQEDTAIDWDRSDYDPYARTKKFCEHMGRELLPDVQRTIFRPSIVLGDSRRPETTQFDMVRAFVFLAGLPMLPFRPNDQLDIVPVDYVADGISTLHMKEKPAHEIYHLASGRESETFIELTEALSKAQGKRSPVFVPSFEKSTEKIVN